MDNLNHVTMELQQGDVISMGKKVFQTNGKYLLSTGEGLLRTVYVEDTAKIHELELTVIRLRIELDNLYANKLVRLALWICRKLHIKA